MDDIKMKLRDYQIELMQLARDAMQTTKKILIVAPTGAGKTALIIEMIKNALTKNKKILFFVHQKKLIEQTSIALKKQNIDHGFLAAGYPKKTRPLMLCMIQTYNRRELTINADLMIIDEAHRSASNIYTKAILNSQYLIGLTATPERTDGKPLGDYFQKMIETVTIKNLIDKNYLCSYELYGAAVEADFSNVKKTRGDYDAKQLSQVLNKNTITGDAVAHYKKYAFKKRCVVMCVNVEHAKSVAETYRAAGISALYLAGECSDLYQKILFKKFESGEIHVITCVNLLIEGVDIPAIECVQWLRPTQSLIVYMQGNGRGLRPHSEKKALIILDHVGNYLRHGLPCEERSWSLDGRKKNKDKSEKIENITTCKSCFLVYKSSIKICPHCGFEPEKRERKIYETQEGELKKITEAKQKTPKTMEEIVIYGIEKGYKNPEAWAAHIIASRQKRKPTAADFSAAKKLRAKIDERNHALSSVKFNLDFSE